MNDSDKKDVQNTGIVCATIVLVVATLCYTWHCDWKDAYEAGYRPIENKDNGLTSLEKKDSAK